MAADLLPELIMMDVMMPKKDGMEACREIMESAPETLVVMLTASAGRGRRGGGCGRRRGRIRPEGDRQGATAGGRAGRDHG